MPEARAALGLQVSSWAVTMRLLWLLLLAAAASGFEVGKEYVYRYKGTMHVFSPEQRDQSAGMAFRSKVIVQPKADNTHFKIADFESDTFNSDDINIERHEFNYASNEHLVGALEHPFAGKFDEGKFEEIEIGKSEPLWVKNLKKGILSLFQVDLVKGRHEHHDDKEYHVKEHSLHGACDTLYIVHKEERNHIALSKVKNLEKCDNARVAVFGRMKGERCDMCVDHEAHPQYATTDVYYELEGTAQQYVIHHASEESSHLFKPHGDAKRIIIIINRTLDLDEQHDAAFHTPLPEDAVKEHSLQQEFAQSDHLKDLEELKHPNPIYTAYGIHSNKEKFVEVLKQLAQLEFTDDDIGDIEHKPSGASLFLALVQAFSSFSYEDINDVYQHHVLAAPADIKASIGHIFLDLLSATGMNPHILFGLNLIKNEEVSESDADNFYSKIQLNLKEVSSPMVHVISDSCKSEAVKKHHEVWSTCKLAASAVAGGKGCRHAPNDQEDDHGTCSPDNVSHFFNYSVTPSDTHEDKDYEITVYLRAAGNLATRKAIHYLERFICPKGHAKEHHRMSALWALKQASVYHPELHMRYVLPIWEHVGKLRMPVDRTYSHLDITSSYYPKYDYGTMVSTEMIRSRDSYLPRNMYFMMRDYRAGRSYEKVTLSFESWGLDKVFNELVGPHPGSSKSIWNFFGRRRFPRDASARELEEIETALPIQDREYDPVYARLTLSMFGKTVDSWDIGNTILEVLNGVKIEKGHPEQAAKRILGEGQDRKKNFFLSYDIAMAAPTEMGVPVFFDFKQADFFYAQFHNVDLTTGDNAQLTLDLKRHYIYEGQSYQMIGFSPQFTNHAMGTGYTSKTIISWPLDLKATFAPLEGKLNVHRPLHLPWNIAVHKFEPFTFDIPNGFNADPTHAATEFANSIKPLYKPVELEPVDWHYLDDLFGVSLRAKGHLISRGLHQSIRELLYKMTWSERALYLAINPFWHYRDIKLLLVPAAEDPTKEVDFEISYKFLEPEDARESHFPVHDKIDGDPEVPSTHVLHMGLNFKGDTKERKAIAEMRYSYSHNLFNHKVQFFYEQTPFQKDDHNVHKVCFDASAKFPQPEWPRIKLATFYTEQHVDAKLNLRYGTSCEGQTSITIDGKYTQTDEDAEQLRAFDAGKPISRNRHGRTFLHRIAKACNAGRAKGLRFNKACYSLHKYSSRFGKLDAEVEWHNFKPLLKQLYPYYAKYYAYMAWKAGFLGIIRSHIENENGKLHVVSQVPWWRPEEQPRTNMVVTTADGQSHEHWNVATFSRMLEPRVNTLLGYTNLAEYSDLYRHKYCDLQAHSVRTFDDALVELPETDCWKVVSRDCSPNKRFVILARALNNTSLTKEVKIFIHKTKIEMLPGSPDSGVAVRVDGTTVDVEIDRPYSHTEQDNELFRISTIVRKKYMILVSESYGLYVGFGGNFLVVQAAPFYRGKLCGLCGDYNLDRNHELSGPDGHLYNSTLEFARSYVVPSSDCHPSEY